MFQFVAGAPALPYPGCRALPAEPVRQCYRYLTKRLHQLDYPRALANDLPIGSGEIESAHRYIVQQRLKLPGACRCAENTEHMLALRLNPANRQCRQYWSQKIKQAASLHISLNRTRKKSLCIAYRLLLMSLTACFPATIQKLNEQLKFM